MNYKLPKSEKLRSRTAVNRVFSEGKSLMAYPLRAAYRLRPADDQPVQFLITIPKKRIRKAVRRVLLRRRVREAYRLNRQQLLTDALQQCHCGVDIAFIYLSDSVVEYDVINAKMQSLLQRLAQQAEQYAPQPQQPQE